MSPRDSDLTLEKLKIAERLALAEGQLGAIKTLLTEEMKRLAQITERQDDDVDGKGKDCRTPVQPVESANNIGKSLGAAALLATVLIAVVSPIHQKIDFTTKLIDGTSARITAVQTSQAQDQSKIAVLEQKFVETDGKFDSLNERTKRMEETTTREDVHIREMLAVKFEAHSQIEEAKRELLRVRFENQRKREIEVEINKHDGGHHV